MRGSQPPAGPAQTSYRRVRPLALGLMALAFVFYFGFIAITIYRSHH